MVHHNRSEVIDHLHLATWHCVRCHVQPAQREVHRGVQFCTHKGGVPEPFKVEAEDLFRREGGRGGRGGRGRRENEMYPGIEACVMSSLCSGG